MEAFSDAVFAIAITLLVLEIKVVPAEFEHLRKALAQRMNHARWPSGSHSRKLGGINNSWSRSQLRKFWGMRRTS